MSQGTLLINPTIPTLASKSVISDNERRFGALVFNRRVMDQMLPTEVCNNIYNAIEGKERIKVQYADTIALAMKEWAVANGANHFCHWFQPLNEITAEKHDSFIEWKTTDSVISKFSGKQLIQGEADASSFPSGGLRVTYEARGYTGWDPSSNVFIWKSGKGATLCIPSVFFSYTGEVLDNKIPLLRSDERICEAALRLLQLTGTPATRVFSTLGWEQEYFVIDREFYYDRPDLVMLGQTVYGKPPAKGQDLQDHYFGVVKDRILSYMQDCEDRAIELGIPVKTRHNEVAPAQHEVAAVFEKASRSVDHNLMFMEIMRQEAAKHDLACLLQEKPFAHFNGSGKHNNWSLGTDTGYNLLNPTDNPENSIQFLIVLTAVLDAIHTYAAVLRSSVASFGNDFRLGGHEAPPSIISVYLGDTLERVLNEIEENKTVVSTRGDSYNLGLLTIPELPKDNSDRNRTSPFAFTGNKFEFRAVGASQSCSFPITVINVIVADSLHRVLDEIEQKLQKQLPTPAELTAAALPVLRKSLKKSKPIRFSGDNYTKEWEEEAARRKLPNVTHSLYAFDALRTSETQALFEGILSRSELISRYQICVEKFYHQRDIEVDLCIEIFYTRILPAVVKLQKDLGSCLLQSKDLGLELPMALKQHYQKIQNTLDEAIKNAEVLKNAHEKAVKESEQIKNKAYAETLPQLCRNLRSCVDRLENLVDAEQWPLPSYWEMLFLV